MSSREGDVIISPWGRGPTRLEVRHFHFAQKKGGEGGLDSDVARRALFKLGKRGEKKKKSESIGEGKGED